MEGVYDSVGIVRYARDCVCAPENSRLGNRRE